MLYVMLSVSLCLPPRNQERASGPHSALDARRTGYCGRVSQSVRRFGSSDEISTGTLSIDTVVQEEFLLKISTVLE